MCKHLAILSALSDHSPGFFLPPQRPPQMQTWQTTVVFFSAVRVLSLWTLLLRIAFTTFVLLLFLEKPGGPTSHFLKEKAQSRLVCILIFKNFFIITVVKGLQIKIEYLPHPHPDHFDVMTGEGASCRVTCCLRCIDDPVYWSFIYGLQLLIKS